MKLSKKTLILFFIFINLECLTAIYRNRFIEERKPEPILSPDCKYFSQGHYPPKPYLVENYGGTLLVSSLSIDIASFYYLYVLNPWYAFGYFTVTYPFAAYESFPPETIVFGSWCGSPEAPLQLPANFLYAVQYRGASDKCVLSDEEKISILGQALWLGNYDSKIDAKILLKQKEIKFISYTKPVLSGNACYHSLQVQDGFHGLKTFLEK